MFSSKNFTNLFFNSDFDDITSINRRSTVSIHNKVFENSNELTAYVNTNIIQKLTQQLNQSEFTVDQKIEISDEEDRLFLID